MIAAALLLDVGNAVGQTGGNDPIIAPGTYDNSDRINFTNPTLTIGSSGGETRFNGYTEFGNRRADGDTNVTLDIVGGTNIFNHQNIYIGARRSSGDAQGNGQDVVVNVSGGDNTFTQRVLFGGAANAYPDSATAGATFSSGKSTVTFSGGNNNFTYHPMESGFGASEGYYGVYFSAMSVQEGNYFVTSGGANVDFEGGTNVFDTEVHFGGNYDLTTYCHTSTSSDDPDVVYGGTHVINFAGGNTTFAYRTTIGGANSNTTVNFTGGEVVFTGAPQLMELSEEIDPDRNGPLYGYLNLSEGRAYLADASVDNTYRGNDLPYVYFGGKNMTKMDIISYEAGHENSTIHRGNIGGSATTVVNINGEASNYKTTSVGTTAFFGGVDDRWLAGDQYEYVDGEYAPRFRWYLDSDELVEINASQPNALNGTSAIRKDTGACALNLINGNLTVGVVNTTRVIDEMGSENGTSDFYITSVRDRYEQVRLIGASTGSVFNATGGTITFEVKKHDLSAIDLSAAGNGNLEHGYFHELEETYKGVQVLEAGMIAFDRISISGNTNIALKNITALIDTSNPGAKQEFYTNIVFVDTTDSDTYQTTKYNWLDENGKLQEEYMASNIDVDALAEESSEKLEIGEYIYQNHLYTITVEDAVDDGTAGVQSAAARLHIEMKSYDDAFGSGNAGLNRDDKIPCVMNRDPSSSLYQAWDYINSTSGTAEDFAANFDQLIGASYASMANHQINRITNRNTLLANQLLAVDVATENVKYNIDVDPCCPQRNWTAWAIFHGMNGETAMNHHLSGYSSESYDAIFALEVNNGVGFHGGVYFEYGESNLNSSADLGWTSIDSTDYTLGLYLKWLSSYCCGYGMINTSITWSDYEAKRFFNDAPENYAADYDGILPSVYYERGWIWVCNDTCTINPYLGLQYAYYNSDAFNESGTDVYGNTSDLSLTVSEVEHNSLRTFLGMRLSRDVWFGRDCDNLVTLRANIAWVHELLSETSPMIYTTHADDPCGPWKVRGNSGGRDWANLGVGLNFEITERLSALVDYDAFVNEHTTLHTGMASLRFEF